MTEKVSTLAVRQRLGDMLNRVALRNDQFIIERKGKALAALVPVQKLAQLQEIARRHGLEFLARQKERRAAPGEEEAMALALEAQRWARRRRRKPTHRRK
jgi:antitoxin (DNA-binding transcriptional repressor) of toxin-antitoxin stability system